jgi:hypothetical protein
MDSATLDEAMTIADGAASARDAAAALRARFGALRVVVVDAFDMRGEPVAARGIRRQLHFGASQGHCWAVTADATQATGLFVADLD